jgi:hypothetical protein
MLEMSSTTGSEPSLSSSAKPGGRKRKTTDTDRGRESARHKIKCRERRLAGLCGHGHCPRKAQEGHIYCREHLARMRERANERRNERIAQGVCISCGERPQFWGRRCAICRHAVAKNPLPNGARRALKESRNLEQQRKKQLVQFAVMELIASGRVKGKEAEALRLYFGIDFREFRSYREVGQLMNLSHERIRQLIMRLKLLFRKEIDVSLTASFGREQAVDVNSGEESDCESCDGSNPRMRGKDRYLYEQSGLPNVFLVGVPVVRCAVCEQNRLAIPSLARLNDVLAKYLVWKSGPLTGAEFRFIRTVCNRSIVEFANDLGVGVQTLMSWENASSLRYRDDLSVRIVGAGHLNLPVLSIQELIETMRRNVRPSYVEVRLVGEGTWGLINAEGTARTSGAYVGGNGFQPRINNCL